MRGDFDLTYPTKALVGKITSYEMDPKNAYRFDTMCRYFSTCFLNLVSVMESLITQNLPGHFDDSSRKIMMARKGCSHR